MKECMDGDARNTIIINRRMKYKYVFTVFTTKFNRLSTIRKVRESSKDKAFGDFEWFVVDDDTLAVNTKELVEQWREEADFPIRYYYRKNLNEYLYITNNWVSYDFSSFIHSALIYVSFFFYQNINSKRQREGLINQKAKFLYIIALLAGQLRYIRGELE